MDHFVTMNDGFREFVSLDGAPAVLLLALPIIRIDKKQCNWRPQWFDLCEMRMAESNTSPD
jgi:hypothetical protein